jgi:hypothetical protein
MRRTFVARAVVGRHRCAHAPLLVGADHSSRCAVSRAQVVAGDYDWLVAKDEASVYEGGPTKRWLKVKQKGWTVEEDRWQRRISVAPPGPLIAGRGRGWLAVRSRR